MQQLSWEDIHHLANRQAKLLTKNKKPFQIIAASEVTLTVRVSTGEEHTLSRSNLEKAVVKIQSGTILNGPQDYRDLVADDRPTYAADLQRQGHDGKALEKAEPDRIRKAASCGAGVPGTTHIGQ